MTEYSVYILRCGDDSLYTGIAVDPMSRIEKHRAGQGAKYVRGRGPLSLVFAEPAGDRASAMRAEYRVKQLDRQQKQALIDGQFSLHDMLSDQVSSISPA